MSQINYIDGTLYDVIERSAIKEPNKIAYEFMGKKTTYAKFLKDINIAAKSLTKLGVKEDDIVCIAMPNVPQAITMFYAVNKIGAICNMIHPLSSEKEMLSFLNSSLYKTYNLKNSKSDNVKQRARNSCFFHII